MVVTELMQSKFRKAIMPPCCLDVSVERRGAYKNAFDFDASIKLADEVVSEARFRIEARTSG